MPHKAYAENSKEELDVPNKLDPTSRTLSLTREAIGGLRHEMAIREEALRDYTEEKIRTAFATLDGRINACLEKFIAVSKDLHDIENAQALRIGELRDVTARIGVTESQILGQKEATALALAAQTLTVDIAQQTAERAVAKAEAAADKRYLESQTEALEKNFAQQIMASRDALVAGSKAQREALDAALAASERAIAKAEVSTEKRFESVNEFRNALTDQQKNFATNSEVYLRFAALEEKVNTAFTILNETKGRASGALGAQSTVFAFVIAGVAIAGLLFTVLTFSLK